MGKKVNGNGPLGWDEPLLENMKHHWSQWRDLLPKLEKVLIPCCHHPKGFDPVTGREIHAFSNASKEAIRAVPAWIQQRWSRKPFSFFRWSKMAPSHMMSIPRLVLCSEILVTQDKMMNRIELDIEIDEEIYYSDSKVVLGYIQNESRGFYVHNATAPSQGRYINTARNPADLATHSVTPQLETDSSSRWILGPYFLWNPLLQPQASLLEVRLSERNPEVKREVITCAKSTHSP